MKKIKFLIILFVLVFAAVSCDVGRYQKIRIGVQGKSLYSVDPYESITITDFLVKKSPEDFDINKELVEYFSYELEKIFEKKIIVKKDTRLEDENFENIEFWKSFIPDTAGTLVFTGSIEYTEEVRKALIDSGKRRFETPFPAESRMYQRKFYTINLDLYLIETKTGRSIYKKTIKETKAYTNPNQSASYAFYELMKKAKDRFLRDLTGGQRLQERYLILK
jgi:hypothetical protein